MKPEYLEKYLEEIQTKKISVNLDEKTLNLIDDLSEIVGTTRTNIISALLGYGIKKYVDMLEKIWANMKKDRKYNKEKLDKKLEKLQKFKKKYEVEKFP